MRRARQGAGLPGSRGARRPAERRHELAVDLLEAGIHVEPRLDKEGARMLALVDARRLDRGLGKTDLGQEPQKLLLLERAGDAAHPEFHAPAHYSRHLAPHYHIAHGKAAA